jgi:hypothetical protein
MAMRVSRIGPWLALLAIVALSLAWRLPNLDAFGISNDEGTHLMWAKLANAGFPLYSQTRAVQGPLFIGLIQLSFKVLGVHVAAGRWMELSLGMVTLLSVGLLARSLRGWVAAYGAAIALSVAPPFFQFSRIVRGDVAASAFLMLALLSGYTFRKGGHRAWLAVAGMLISASLLVKAVYPLAFLLVLLLILQRRGMKPGNIPSAVRQAAGDGLIFGLGLVLPLALCFIVYDPAGLWDTLITFRLELRAARPWSPAANIAEIGSFLAYNAALGALAVWGWLSLFLARPEPAHAETSTSHLRPGEREVGRWWRGDSAVMSLWLAATAFTLMWHTPLFPQHLISLLLPMAVLAGVAVEDSVHRLLGWPDARWQARVGGLIGLALVGFYGTSLPGWLAADEQARAGVTGGREADAIEWLRTVTSSDDFILSDNLMLPFMADRLSPPSLGDIAQVAIDSGRQNSQQLIAISEAYPVEAVADWALRLPYLKDYMAWVEQHYLARRVWDDHHVIYFGRKVAAREVPHPRSIKFDDGIELVGYEALLSDTARGEPALWRVTLYWAAYRRPTQDYTVFVHVYDAAGKLVTSHDGPPLFGYLPTSIWGTLDIVPDRHTIPLPDDWASGEYRLVAGMYNPATSRRLPLVDAQGIPGGDSTELERVTVR